jgi:hypothetical protein
MTRLYGVTRFLDSFELTPIVCRIGCICRAVSKQEQVRLAPFAIACAAMLHDLDKAKSFNLANAPPDVIAPDSVLAEILKCHWQSAIIASAVMSQLDFNTTKDTMTVKAQDTICR